MLPESGQHRAGEFRQRDSRIHRRAQGHFADQRGWIGQRIPTGATGRSLLRSRHARTNDLLADRYGTGVPRRTPPQGEPMNFRRALTIVFLLMALAAVSPATPILCNTLGTLQAYI